MATPKIKYVITAKDQTKQAFSSARKQVNSLKSSIVQLAGAYAALRVVSSVINKHREFTAAIADLSAITGAAGKDLEFLTAKSKEFGRTTTLTASQAAQAFKLVASAKPDLLENAKALAIVTKEVIILAEASGAELTDSAKTVGSALNQFAADASEAARFVNVLAAGAKFGASEIADTSEALKVAGLVARSAGASFEETNAALQALSTVAIKGAEAGTGLRNIYLNLAKQSREDFKPEVVGLTQALKNLRDSNLSTNELLDIFGKRNIVAARALIETADKVENLTLKLTGTNIAYDQAAIKVNTLDGDIKQMNSATEGLALSIGEELNPVLRGAVQNLRDLAKILDDTVGGSGGKLAKLITAWNITWLELAANIRESGAALSLFLSKITFGETSARHLQAAKEDLAGAARLWAKAALETQIQIEILEDLKLRGADALVPETPTDTDKSESDEDKGGPAGRTTSGLAAALETQLATVQTFLLSEEDRLIESYRRRQEIVNNALGNDIDRKAQKNQILEDLRVNHEKKLLEIQKKGFTAGQKFQLLTDKQKLQSVLKTGIAMTQGVAQSSRKMFEINKALALAQAAVSLPAAVIDSFKNAGGYPWGIIPAGLMLATGLQNIAAINSASFGGGGGSASIGSGGGGGLAPSLQGQGLDGVVGTIDLDGDTGGAKIINIDMTDSMVSSEAVVKMINAINDEVGDGVMLKATVVVS